MQKSIVTEIRSYMKIYEMLRPGDRVIAAVSGGADSVCLLWALQKIAPELPAFLRVVHVHHGLRGEEADRDERFVEDLCRKLEIPFQTVRCNAALPVIFVFRIEAEWNVYGGGRAGAAL